MIVPAMLLAPAVVGAMPSTELCAVRSSEATLPVRAVMNEYELVPLVQLRSAVLPLTRPLL